MADVPFGFDRKSVERIGAAVRTTENLPEYSTHKRGRYPIAAGGATQLSHGVIVGVCNADCSTYLVQRLRRTLATDCGSGSGSGSE